MKKKKRYFVSSFAVCLSAIMLLSAFGCGGTKTTTAGNAAGSAAGSAAEAGSAVGSAAENKAEGSAVETGGMEQSEETQIPQGEKYMALTFDDGPTGNEDGLTEQLLDGLKERGVHATFFLCGYRIKDYNSMMDRYLSEGHEIGNHTMDHLNLTTEVGDGGLEQVSDNSDLIQSYTGQYPTLVRPTGGAYDECVESAMKDLGLPIILWNLDTEDWRYRDASSVKSHILEQAEDGSIVLEHDLYDTTVEGVLAAIDELQEQGYAFVTVSELAKIKGVTLEPGVVYNDFTEETLHPESDESAVEGSSDAAGSAAAE